MALLLKFIEKFKANLATELAVKTGWGRNEVSAAVQRALDKTLIEVAVQ